MLCYANKVGDPADHWVKVRWDTRRQSFGVSGVFPIRRNPTRRKGLGFRVRVRFSANRDSASQVSANRVLANRVLANRD